MIDEPKIKAELFPKLSTYVQRNLFELLYVFGLKFQLKDNLLYKLLLFCGYTETLIYDFDSSFNPHITYCQNYDHMVDIWFHLNIYNLQFNICKNYDSVLEILKYKYIHNKKIVIFTLSFVAE